MKKIFSTDPNVVRMAGCVPDSSVDGPGIRYVLFLQGCFHGCAGCHNPATHPWNSENAEDVPIEVIIEHFKANSVAKRITISGGEPFGQPYALLCLLKEFKKLGVEDIWIYTGYELEDLLSEDIFKEILTYCDTVVTGRFDMTKREGAPLFAGSSNQKLIDVKQVLK